MTTAKAANKSNTTGRRKRGRPPQLSQERIFRSALNLLVAEGGSITMARLAEALDVVPMALYRYVSGWEQVADGVLGLILQELPPPILTNEPWQDQLGQWMFAFREHMLQYPFAIWFLGSRHHVAPAWLAQMNSLVPILQCTGLEGEQLALAHTWMVQSTVGAVMGEIETPATELAPEVSNLLAGDNEYAEYATVIQNITTDERIYRFFVERTLSALEGIAANQK